MKLYFVTKEELAVRQLLFFVKVTGGHSHESLPVTALIYSISAATGMFV